MTEATAGNWDHEVDVLVVGTGAGAMTAALKAHDEGGDVLLIEKSSQYGGSSAMSSCLLWVPNNHLMPGVGIDDSPEEALEYLKGTTEGVVAEERLIAYRDKGPEMLRYLTEKTRVELVGLPEYPDYYPAVKGSKPGGRSVEPDHFNAKLLGDDFLNLRSQNLQMQVMGRLGMTAVEARMVMTGQPGGMPLFAKLMLKYAIDIPWRVRSTRDRNPSGGNALIGMLRLSLRERNVPLWLETPARDLVLEDGRVVGIEAERNGASFRIHARKGQRARAVDLAERIRRLNNGCPEAIRAYRPLARELGLEVDDRVVPVGDHVAACRDRQDRVHQSVAWFVGGVQAHLDVVEDVRAVVHDAVPARVAADPDAGVVTVDDPRALA